jgi:hypothetical protein
MKYVNVKEKESQNLILSNEFKPQSLLLYMFLYRSNHGNVFLFYFHDEWHHQYNCFVMYFCGKVLTVYFKQLNFF